MSPTAGVTPLDYAILVGLGAIASGINAVAGGGSLISFPGLTVGLGISERIANATNAVGIFPGSLAGGLGFANLFKQTKGYLSLLVVPTFLGSLAGSFLLLNTSDSSFKKVIPFLVLAAALILLAQPWVKRQLGHEKTLPVWAGLALQFLVSLYGGYFGAGMGIMMLACFAFYMNGTIHELNAVKNWLGLVINFTCSAVFFVKGLVILPVALALVVGSLIGGYYAAKLSQRVDPERLRLPIVIYGLTMAAFFAYRAFG